MSLEITPLGDSALIVRVGDSLGEVLALQRLLAGAKISGVEEVAPALASVAVFFESPTALTNAAATLQALLRGRRPAPPALADSRLVEVPVCYEPAYGLDLLAVAEHTRLTPREIALRHASVVYEVRCVGFTPGFPYLSGLPNALATPRRAAPRTVVPSGSVAIAGAQTGIYPLASPGGWNIIGRTPLQLFDAAREPAALLQAGDRVRFVAVTETEFARWEK